MKILIGMPSKDSWGGPIASEPPFAAALGNLDVDVVTEDYVYGDKEKPTPFLSRIARVLKTAFRFRRLLRENSFDLIHLNTAFDLRTLLRDSASIFIMRPGKAKVFLKIHGSTAESFIRASFFTRSLINYLKRRVDGFGVHTTKELNAFLRLGYDRSKFYRVKNAVTIQAELPVNFERLQKESTEIFEILFVSRFIAAKGLLESIRACSILREKGIQFILHCVGDGEIRAEAELAVTKLGLDDQVRFTGYIPEDDVTKLFTGCDLFVFPTSHAEGFPNVLFKAVSAGMPVVTTKVRAAAEYLKDPENCLFSSTDAGDIAEKLAQLISDKKLRESMSAGNIEYGKSLEPEIIAGEFLNIYLKICGQPSHEVEQFKSVGE